MYKLLGAQIGPPGKLRGIGRQIVAATKTNKGEKGKDGIATTKS